VSGSEDYRPASWDPPVDLAAVDGIAERLSQAGLPVERNRPLRKMTTLGVGGAARVYVELADLPAAQAFSRTLATSSAEQVPLFVLGKGSNTLISDAGFDGVVVHLGAGHKWIRRDGLRVRAGGGEAMPALAAWCAREGLAGLEFAAGIPATVGGSVRMNAGAHGGEVAASLLEVDLVEVGGEVRTAKPPELGFGYRQSVLPARSLVIAAHWGLAPDDPVEIRHRLDDLRAWRRRTQPLRDRNCGSVFTNPPGASAGALIEAAGGKHLQVGGARVSEKHANFITTSPACTASDVRQLIGEVRRAVLAHRGPLLEPEVRLVGHFAS